MIVKTKALVIKENTFGESDKYITLFTKEMGKIQVLAPKAKKTDRGFASGTQLFVYGDFILTTFRDTYRLVAIEVIEMFHNIRNDLEALSYASYIAEFIQSVTEEGLLQPELLKLTLLTLKQLSKGNLSPRLIRRVFELRAIGLIGFMPQLEACAACDERMMLREDERYRFSVSEGGLVCYHCLANGGDSLLISYSSLYTMKYILSIDLGKLFRFNVTDDILKELEKICDRYIPYYLDKPFKTLDFIERLEEL